MGAGKLHGNGIHVIDFRKQESEKATRAFSLHRLHSSCINFNKTGFLSRGQPSMLSHSAFPTPFLRQRSLGGKY